MGGYKKKCAPRSIVFSPRLARARVSMSCESAVLMQALCVCKSFSFVPEGARCHIPALPAWEQAGMFNARALGQSAQASQDTPIFRLYHVQPGL